MGIKTSAQTITAFGSGTTDTALSGQGVIRVAYVDPITNDLYAGGDFEFAGGKRCYGIARWNGTEWFPLGGGLVDSLGYFYYHVQDIKRLNNEIYIGGNFNFVDGVNSPGISRYNGNTWQKVGDSLKARGGPYGTIIRMEVFNNELYVVGLFDSIGTLKSKSIAKWDGINWNDMSNGFPTSNCYVDRYMNTVKAFNNELYVGGNMNCSPNEEYLLKRVGNSWVQVGQPFNGDVWLNYLTEFQNKLYVGGYFFAQNGNVDNGLVYIDNNITMPTAGGVLPSNCDVMQAHRGELYVAGQIDNAGSQPINRIGKWDGTQWLNTGLSVTDSNRLSDPRGTILSMTEYNGKLLVAGSFTHINNTPANNIALIEFPKVGINENKDDKNLTIFPNPTSNLLNIQLEKGLQEGSIKLYNQLGQVVYSQTKGVFQPIDVSTFAKGVYFAEVKQEDKVMRQKVVVE